ncbi:MAG: acyl-CoA dehydratase activase [Desulfobacterales bacterium]|nr:acyl-CoA dehydratase activase [Desulfobacterales bacterium]
MGYMGIDIGSSTCCAVLLNKDKEILASAMVPTGARNEEAIRRVVDQALDRAGMEESSLLGRVSTGYGRKRVENRDFDKTEIVCHAKGILTYFPDTSVLIDIGGQDSKAIAIHRSGRVVNFAMNDKCAAGTGRFLETMARVLEIDIKDMDGLDIGERGTRQISNMCTVFAESEVVSLIAQGVDTGEIISGINRAIATRTFSLAKRVATDMSGETVAISGGVARISGVVAALERCMGSKILVPPHPGIIGALGAAVFALEG